jgi:hypothetical protein
MNSGSLRLCVGALFIVLWAGCYPGEIDSASQTDVVLTFHAPGADFGVNNTFSMPNTIVDLGVAAGGGSTFDHQYDAQILSKIAQQFVSMGYTRVDSTVKADAVVLVSGVTIDNYSAWTGYPWWGYWGWWGWGPYGYSQSNSATSQWYYPWAPVVVTSYKSGTIFISLIDPDVAPPSGSGTATTIWAAALNGMLEGTNSDILARINTNIVQAFAQSSYLSTQ